MEDVLERLSAQQFVATLDGDEFVCLLALELGYTQVEIAADVFGQSPATVCRLVNRIRSKYEAWNR